MVIDTILVRPQRAGMVSRPKVTEEKVREQLPPHVLDEMRPERIGARLKLLREALGLKPSEMADALGIERTYWSRFENGKRAITEQFAALLVDRFGVTYDFLILGRWGGLPLELAAKMRAVDSRKS